MKNLIPATYKNPENAKEPERDPTREDYPSDLDCCDDGGFSVDGQPEYRRISSSCLVSVAKTRQGFSLIELMIVIAIISVVTTFAIPAYQNYVVSANSTKLNVHYKQAINWVRAEMARLQTRIAGGGDLAAIEDARDEDTEWVNALLNDVAGAETASPLGGPAFVVASSDAAADAVSLALSGSIADGSLQVTVVRPIFGEWESADSTDLCWGGVDCVSDSP